ncbi:AraC-type DNA-binding protein [Chitinophaga eiseniae]|uniref:AraC-type DNA-binding protein n=1 Tax=Chitinophaga eiseniae TaxID=634771 RepID=A0A1T4QR84_9BACT|nr:AraC family transcriptional regulator [Chitinophaga eiseniae]SKA06001.1 AraC-type DNA-binding protein [Chitinophaga eiseniae]
MKIADTHIRYELIPAPAHLQAYIRYFWTLEGDDPQALAKAFGSLVDGCPGLIFQRPDAGAFIRESKKLPEMFLYGQTTKNVELASLGAAKATGVIFQPNGLKSVFGLNAGELTNDCVDVHLLPGHHHLPEQLTAAGSTTTQVDILSAWLHNRITGNGVSTDPQVDYAVAQIAAANGAISLRDLQEKLQLTERTFERRFKEQVGITPKLFSRICQYQASLHQLKSSDYNKLSDIAFENDYADQSHFIRSFKEFTGCSPYQFQKLLDETGEEMLRLK